MNTGSVAPGRAKREAERAFVVDPIAPFGGNMSTQTQTRTIGLRAEERVYAGLYPLLQGLSQSYGPLFRARSAKNLRAERLLDGVRRSMEHQNP
jgi:hypothetical protein